jgi:hypothetical protein
MISPAETANHQCDRQNKAASRKRKPLVQITAAKGNREKVCSCFSVTT